MPWLFVIHIYHSLSQLADSHPSPRKQKLPKILKIPKAITNLSDMAHMENIDQHFANEGGK